MYYSLMTITNSVLAYWKISNDEKINLQAKIRRVLHSDGVKSIKFAADKKTKLYPISDLDEFATSAAMVKYCNKRSNLTDTTKKIKVGASAENHNKILRHSEEVTALGLSQLDKVQAGKITQEKIERDESTKRKQQNKINQKFQQKKFEFMIEALFNRHFTLNREALLDDVKKVVEFDTMINDESLSTIAIESARQRLENWDAYIDFKE